MTNRLPNILGAAALLSALTLSGLAQATEPVKQWELEGLKNPESALPDTKAGIIYVSNVNGTPTDKDGNGFISKVSPEGKIVTAEWVTGLDAPKGLILSGTKLYVSDIDKLVEIDTATGKITAKFEAPGAKFLNDTAVDKDGNIYVSDMATNVIWRLSGGKFEKWLESAALKNPNGLYVEGDTLIVAAWGVMTDGFATKVPAICWPSRSRTRASRTSATAPCRQPRRSRTPRQGQFPRQRLAGR